MLLHIFTRRHSIYLLEHGGEAGGRIESAAIHYLRDALSLVTKHTRSLLHAQITDEVMRCLIGQFLHLAVEMHTTDTHF